MTRTEQIVRGLRDRAAMALALKDAEAHRILRGYADAIERDPQACKRIRARLAESILPVDADNGSPIDRLWRDALADLDVGHVRPSAPVVLPPIRSTVPAATSTTAQADAATAAAIVVLTRRVDRLGTELAEERATRGAVSSQVEAFAARVATLSSLLTAEQTRSKALAAQFVNLESDTARRTEVAAILADLHEQLALETRARVGAEGALLLRHSGPIVDRLRAHRLPDGRTWLDVVREVGARHGVSVDDIASRARTKTISAARHEVWWWLQRRSGTRVSALDIGRAWGRDHSTVRSGIVAHERLVARSIAAAAPPSGPRLRGDHADAQEVADVTR